MLTDLISLQTIQSSFTTPIQHVSRQLTSSYMLRNGNDQGVRDFTADFYSKLVLVVKYVQ